MSRAADTLDTLDSPKFTSRVRLGVFTGNSNNNLPSDSPGGATYTATSRLTSRSPATTATNFTALSGSGGPAKYGKHAAGISDSKAATTRYGDDVFHDQPAPRGELGNSDVRSNYAASHASSPGAAAAVASTQISAAGAACALSGRKSLRSPRTSWTTREPASLTLVGAATPTNDKSCVAGLAKTSPAGFITSRAAGFSLLDSRRSSGGRFSKISDNGTYSANTANNNSNNNDTRSTETGSVSYSLKDIQQNQSQPPTICSSSISRQPLLSLQSTTSTNPAGNGSTGITRLRTLSAPSYFARTSLPLYSTTGKANCSGVGLESTIARGISAESRKSPGGFRTSELISHSRTGSLDSGSASTTKTTGQGNNNIATSGCSHNGGQLVSSAAAPTVILRPRSQLIASGQTVRFRVSFDGQPRPTVVWLRAASPLQPSDKYSMFEINNCHVLEISDVTEADQGGYTCVISNEHGSETCEAELSVNSHGSHNAAPAVPMSAPPSTDVMQRMFSVQPYRRQSADTAAAAASPSYSMTSSLSLTSSLSQDGSVRRLSHPIRTPLVMGFSDECLESPSSSDATPVTNTPELSRHLDSNKTAAEKLYLSKSTFNRTAVNDELTSPSSTVRTLTSSELHSNGTYASNEPPPSGKISMQNLAKRSSVESASKAAPESLGTTSTSRPTRTFGIPVSSNRQPELPEKDSSRLADPQQQQQPVGAEVTSQFVAPSFDKKPKSSSVVEGDSVCFAFRAHGRPPPDVIWEKDGKPFIPHSDRFKVVVSEDDTSSLEMSGVLQSDAGRYVCIARNVVGESRCTCTLIVRQADFRMLRARPKKLQMTAMERENQKDHSPKPSTTAANNEPAESISRSNGPQSSPTNVIPAAAKRHEFVAKRWNVAPAANEFSTEAEPNVTKTVPLRSDHGGVASRYRPAASQAEPPAVKPSVPAKLALRKPDRIQTNVSAAAENGKVTNSDDGKTLKENYGYKSMKTDAVVSAATVDVAVSQSAEINKETVQSRMVDHRIGSIEKNESSGLGGGSVADEVGDNLSSNCSTVVIDISRANKKSNNLVISSFTETTDANLSKASSEDNSSSEKTLVGDVGRAPRAEVTPSLSDRLRASERKEVEKVIYIGDVKNFTISSALSLGGITLDSSTTEDLSEASLSRDIIPTAAEAGVPVVTNSDLSDKPETNSNSSDLPVADIGLTEPAAHAEIPSPAHKKRMDFWSKKISDGEQITDTSRRSESESGVNSGSSDATGEEKLEKYNRQESRASIATLRSPKTDPEKVWNPETVDHPPCCSEDLFSVGQVDFYPGKINSDADEPNGGSLTASNVEGRPNVPCPSEVKDCNHDVCLESQPMEAERISESELAAGSKKDTELSGVNTIRQQSTGTSELDRKHASVSSDLILTKEPANPENLSTGQQPVNETETEKQRRPSLEIQRLDTRDERLSEAESGSSTPAGDITMDSLEDVELSGGGNVDGEDRIEPPNIFDLVPENVHIQRGSTLVLTAKYTAYPVPAVRWYHGTDQLAEDDRTSMAVDRNQAILSIHNTEPSDTGRYAVELENVHGIERMFSSVTIEDRPDPPVGQPAVTSITRSSIVLSWYGCGYDGGSSVTGYKIELWKGKETDPDGCWKTVTELCSHTSYQVQNLSANTDYRFRISSCNQHGFSDPGIPSDTVVTVDMRPALKFEEMPFEPREVLLTPGRDFKTFYTVGVEIGKGKFGNVSLCTEKSSGRQFAAKFIRVKAAQREEFRQEIAIMNALRHPKILLLWDAFESPRELILVMEHVGGRELLERIISDDYMLTERECVHFMRQICDGVSYMHSCEILHLDLKPENILCITPNSNEIKIIDFGLARKFNPKKSFRVMFGTPEFVAPEVINYDDINFGTDMWSIGVICYLVLSGLSPFAGDTDNETLANVTAAEYDYDAKEFEEISDTAKDFMDKLLIRAVNKRMLASQCLQHEWLSQDVTYMRAKRLSTSTHKRFMARRKWQKTGNAIRALGRMTFLHRLSANNLMSSRGGSTASSSSGHAGSILSDTGAMRKSATASAALAAASLPKSRSLDLSTALSSMRLRPEPAGTTDSGMRSASAGDDLDSSGDTLDQHSTAPAGVGAVDELKRPRSSVELGSASLAQRKDSTETKENVNDERNGTSTDDGRREEASAANDAAELSSTATNSTDIEPSKTEIKPTNKSPIVSAAATTAYVPKPSLPKKPLVISRKSDPHVGSKPITFSASSSSSNPSRISASVPVVSPSKPVAKVAAAAPRRRVLESAGFLAATQPTAAAKPRKPPMFVRKMRNVNIVEGDSARFEVVVDGNPPPTVVWLKDGIEITPDAVKYRVEPAPQPADAPPADGRWTLTITDCGEDDDAEYGCHAVSALGKISSKAELYVEPAGAGEE